MGKGAGLHRQIVVSLPGTTWVSGTETLILQTASATMEMNAQLARVLSATRAAINAVSTLAGILEDMNAVATRMTAALKEQAPGPAEATTTYANRIAPRLSSGWDVCS
jgi:hypothetical protein